LPHGLWNAYLLGKRWIMSHRFHEFMLFLTG